MGLVGPYKQPYRKTLVLNRARYMFSNLAAIVTRAPPCGVILFPTNKWLKVHSMPFLACVAGVRRGGKGERQVCEAREDRTRENRGRGRLQDAIVFFIPHLIILQNPLTVECLAVTIIQSESRHFFHDKKICSPQWFLVFLVLLFCASK